MTSMHESLVSIIIPCYNQADFLDQTLASVLKQTHANWECIMVNDGSQDGTELIAEAWVAKDSRFKYFYKENSGVSDTRNFALERVKGAYIQFLDGDDLLDEKKLELSLNEFNVNRDTKLVISNFRMFTTDPGKTTPPYCNLNAGLFHFESLLYRWNESFSIPIHCGFFKAELFETIRFPKNIAAQEDWIVWIAIFRLIPNVLFVDLPLAFYRRHSNSKTITEDLVEDQLNAYEYLKGQLSSDEFYELSKVLIARYYKARGYFKSALIATKSSNTYKLGYVLKKITKKVGLLKPAKYFFGKILNVGFFSEKL